MLKIGLFLPYDPERMPVGNSIKLLWNNFADTKEDYVWEKYTRCERTELVYSLESIVNNHCSTMHVIDEDVELHDVFLMVMMIDYVVD